MDESFLNVIVALHKEQQWEEILKIGAITSCDITTRLLWVWPSVENLHFIRDKVQQHALDGVISVGCGCGLFEWLVQLVTAVNVIGYEANEAWWNSKYSNPQFIKIQYPVMPPQQLALPKQYALLFCYFNNRTGFAQYMDAYAGNLLFIIGPGEGRGTHTDPEPFNPKLHPAWELEDFQEVRNTKDYIAVYVRNDLRK